MNKGSEREVEALRISTLVSLGRGVINPWCLQLWRLRRREAAMRGRQIDRYSMIPERRYFGFGKRGQRVRGVCKSKCVAHYCIARSKMKLIPDSGWPPEYGGRSMDIGTYLRGRKRYIFSRAIRIQLGHPEMESRKAYLQSPGHELFDEYHLIRRNYLRHDREGNGDDRHAYKASDWRDFSYFGQEFRHGVWVRVEDEVVWTRLRNRE